MRKAELIGSIQESCDLLYGVPLRQKDVAAVIDALGDIAIEHVRQGLPLALPGIGTLAVVLRQGRVGRNPQTGETVNISARRGLKFAPCKALRDELARKP